MVCHRPETLPLPRANTLCMDRVAAAPDHEHAEDAYLRAAREAGYPHYPGTHVGSLPLHGRWFLGIRRIRADDGREYVEIQSWRHVHATADTPVRVGRQRLVFPVEQTEELVALLRDAAARDIGKPNW